MAKCKICKLGKRAKGTEYCPSAFHLSKKNLKALKQGVVDVKAGRVIKVKNIKKYLKGV